VAAVRLRDVGRVDRVVTEREIPTPRYPILADRHRTELVIDRSRFVCTVAPAESVADAQLFVRDVQREFPGATHNCWAFLVGAPGSSDRIGLSDDGEPHGTAGRPMFTVLQHSGLGDIAAVVTRYFGGVKLGTGGLVKAYGGAVQHALDSAPRTMRITRIDINVRVGYASITALKQLFPTFEVDVVQELFDVDVQFLLRCPDDHAEALKRAIADVTRGQAAIS
jgi:uncharacterized YigZ family protein